MSTMKKQYPWISLMTAAVMLMICVYYAGSSSLNFTLCWLGSFAVILVGDVLGCKKANKKQKLFAPNKGVLLASAVLIVPVAAAMINDMVSGSEMFRGLATLMALLLFGAVAAIALTADLLNYLYKKHKLKRGEHTNMLVQSDTARRIDIKPLVPCLIAFAAVMVVQIVTARVLSGRASDVVMYFTWLAYWLLTANMIGLIFNQLMRLRFVNYILMLAYLVYAVERAVYYIGFFRENTEMNASYTQWRVSLCKAELAVLIVLIVADVVALVLTAVSQFKKPKYRKQK